MKKKLALLTVGALFSVAASAPASAAVAGGRDTGTNAAARNVELVRGAARDMPLGQAIHAIVPREFTVRTAGIARQVLDEPVSWSGGRAWTEVLLDLLEPYPDLAADISLSARRVTVRQLPQGARMVALQEEAAAEAAARRTPPAAVQAKPLAALRQPPAANATQETTLAVMQMAIQTATQTAIQSAVQAALQNSGAPAKPTATAQAPVPAAPAAPPPVPPAAPPAPVKAAPPPLPTWEILPRDRSVRTALERWTASAGWQLSWEMAVDYPVVTRTSISGTFETAVEAVAQSLERAEVPVKAVMYRGNRVLRIVAKGSE